MSNITSFNPGEDNAIFLRGVSVSYRLPTERIGTFKEYAIKKVLRKISHQNFLALDGIDLSVKKGEIFGVIGRNGAGKSTLLKVISRVLYPTRGRVWINGIVSPLLELGAGFHPELTGIENIYLNGSLLGHSKKEIVQNINSIKEFSEIGEFINAPIRTYSSGMIARLGFSIATAWTPDILILDEILSVGDVSFQKKCEIKMNSLIKGNSTVLLVSHSPKLISELCSTAILLEHGKVIASGSGQEISNKYLSLLENSH